MQSTPQSPSGEQQHSAHARVARVRPGGLWWVAPVGALAAVALLAAACGSKSAANPASGGSSSSTTSSSSAASSSTSSSPSMVVVKTAKVGSLGTVLVNAEGLTLYYYTLDKPPHIACTTGCTSVWPPLIVPTGAHVSGPSGLSTIMRPNGEAQVTYMGKPLYTFSGDHKAGQANGEGFTKNWYVLKVGTSTPPSGGASTTSTWG